MLLVCWCPKVWGSQSSVTSLDIHVWLDGYTATPTQRNRAEIMHTAHMSTLALTRISRWRERMMPYLFTSTRSHKLVTVQTFGEEPINVTYSLALASSLSFLCCCTCLECQDHKVDRFRSLSAKCDHNACAVSLEMPSVHNDKALSAACESLDLC